MSNLMAATNQWADERFWSVEDLLAHRKLEHEESVAIKLNWKDLQAVGNGGLHLDITGMKAQFTHFSFGQLASTVNAPASYLRTLPSELAARNLNYGLQKLADGGQARNPVVLARQRPSQREAGDATLRALTSTSYRRIWSDEALTHLAKMRDFGWRTPPARPIDYDDPRCRPATPEDVIDISGGGGLSVQVGDIIAPAGVYGSDRDDWVFMINQQNPIKGPDGSPLFRGFFLWNSEVGDKTFGITWFYFRHVCGNHIVWGAEGVKSIKRRHVGSASRDATAQLTLMGRQYIEEAASLDEAPLRRMASIQFPVKRDETIDVVYRKMGTGLPYKTLEAAYDEVIREQDGPPNTGWGFVQGLTRLSQQTRYADERNKIDVAAGVMMANLLN
jgi:hypothetical protein